MPDPRRFYFLRQFLASRPEPLTSRSRRRETEEAVGAAVARPGRRSPESRRRPGGPRRGTGTAEGAVREVARPLTRRFSSFTEWYRRTVYLFFCTCAGK